MEFNLGSLICIQDVCNYQFMNIEMFDNDCSTFA